jgi:hypothetical protein
MSAGPELGSRLATFWETTRSSDLAILVRVSAPAYPKRRSREA